MRVLLSEAAENVVSGDPVDVRLSDFVVAFYYREETCETLGLGHVV